MVGISYHPGVCLLHMNHDGMDGNRSLWKGSATSNMEGDNKINSM